MQVASVDDIAEDGESVDDSELDIEDIIAISDDPHLHDESDCRRQYHDAIGKQLPTLYKYQIYFTLLLLSVF